jgi:PAS domain S-box-containing protein
LAAAATAGIFWSVKRKQQFMGDRERKILSVIAVAILWVAAASGVKLLFPRLLGVEKPFLGYFAAVIITAWYGGMAGGFIATALATLAVTFFFVGTPHSFRLTDAHALIPVAVFAAEACLISFLCGQLHDSWRRAEQDRLALQQSLVTAQAQRNGIVEIIRLSPAFMAVLKGPKHVYELVNDAHAQLVGSRELMGRSVRENFPEVEGQGIYELLDKVYQTGEPFSGKNVRVTLQRQPDKLPEERILELVFQPTRNADGSVSGVFVHGIDRTERIRAEAELERLASVVQNSPDFIGISDLEGNPVFANETAIKMVSAEGIDEIRRTKVSDFFIAEDRSFVRDTVIPTVMRDGRWEGELRLRNFRTGAAIPILYGVFRIDDRATGRPAYFATISRDITEAKKAQDALRESEARFRQLADAMPQIVWTAGPDGFLDYYNRRWFEYINLPETAGDAARWDQYLHPDDLKRVADTWASSVRSGEAYVAEFRVRRADGAYRWFLVRALPITGNDENIVRWFGTCTDIHDQKQLQKRNEELLQSERASRGEAERASRMKDDFLATLSHELRTPLNAILGWSQILRANGSPSTEELSEALEIIERNARAQTQIIEDLLDMSRIISGKVRLDVQRTDLTAIVQASLDTMKPAAEAKGVRLQAALDPLARPVSGDPNRLHQIFWNLISNAIKFTPRGGRVQVLLERINSHLEVSVIDTGEGIKPEFLPHVFDRFRQADASTTRRHGGLGLGLSIVKQLVELHGGTVRVKTAGIGLGSTFTVELPLTVVHAEPESDANRQHPAKSVTAELCRDAGVELQGISVLVVDDEPDARSLVKHVLEECGALVRTASSATEAFELFQSQQPGVLVSDIGMPGDDGYSLIRWIRSLEKEKGGTTPALALTAYARPEDRMKAVRAGFQLHVVKPVEPAELVTMVASLVGRS